MTDITTYDRFEDFGRVRLSQNFFMRDFLHSEIAAWHGIRNAPDHPEQAIAVGRQLCGQLLEPLQATFGRIHIRSGYRSPQVNDFGNKNNLNCARNESNHAAHIWDYPDANGRRGASACIVIPWLVDHIAAGGQWTDMAWWIHDHLPYSKLYFFSKLAAFNINWHELPTRRIDSYAPPKGCLTMPGMPNHAGSHAGHYAGFPALNPAISGVMDPVRDRSPSSPSAGLSGPAFAPSIGKSVPTAPGSSKVDPATVGAALPDAQGAVSYRAIHSKTAWRAVNGHRSLESAINGKDGAAGLFARKVRIDYEKHGNPLYVLVWAAGSAQGYAIKAEPTSSNGTRRVMVPMATLLEFERRKQASQQELEKFF